MKRPGEATDGLCGAKTRQGTPCRRNPMPNGRCNLHGGKSLGGVASPLFKHGRYSKYIPARMLERYNEARDDGELLALREEITLVDARLADLLARIDTGESGGLWRRLRAAHQELLGARDDVAHMTSALELIGALIQRGASDADAWDDITAQVEQRRRLVESERKRLVELRQYVTAESAMSFAVALLHAVRSNISDQHVLTSISEEFIRLIGRNDLSRPAGDGNGTVSEIPEIPADLSR